MARKAAAATKVDAYQRVTEQIVAQLEAGVVPWHKPWADGDGFASLPISMSTGRRYSGINVWLLWSQPYSSPWWGTYKQITELGGQVRKGERATMVMLFKPVPCKEHGSDKCKQGCKSGLVARAFPVFNAQQADDLPERFMAQPVVADREHEPIEAAEALVGGYLSRESLGIIEGDSRACYSPSLDQIRMPFASDFDSTEAYYSTLFHEVTHSTGHKDRLARTDLLEMHAFGDENYSREELCAEMGAAFMSALVGIDQATITASASYIDNWLRALKGDSKLLVKAAADAQRAVDFVIGTVEEEVAA